MRGLLQSLDKANAAAAAAGSWRGQQLRQEYDFEQFINKEHLDRSRRDVTSAANSSKKTLDWRRDAESVDAYDRARRLIADIGKKNGSHFLDQEAKRPDKSNDVNFLPILQPTDLHTLNILSIPKVKVIPEYSSPCFYEQRVGLVARKNTVERALTAPGGKYLRCMPYFMLAGKTIFCYVFIHCFCIKFDCYC